MAARRVPPRGVNFARGEIQGKLCAGANFAPVEGGALSKYVVDTRWELTCKMAGGEGVPGPGLQGRFGRNIVVRQFSIPSP